jgi:hypothetical protein
LSRGFQGPSPWGISAISAACLRLPLVDKIIVRKVLKCNGRIRNRPRIYLVSASREASQTLKTKRQATEAPRIAGNAWPPPTRANGAGGLKASTGSPKRDKNETNCLTLRRGLSACGLRLECGPAGVASCCCRYFEDAARWNLRRQGCRRDGPGPGYAPACSGHNEQVHVRRPLSGDLVPRPRGGRRAQI